MANFESSSNAVEDNVGLIAAGTAAVAAGAIFIASRGRAARTAESLLMSSSGVADATKVDGLNWLNLAKPKQVSVIEDGINSAVSRANVHTLDFTSDAAFDRLLAQGPAPKGGAKILSMSAFKGAAEEAPRLNQTTANLLDGKPLYMSGLKLSLDHQGLTTLARFSKGEEQVLFKPSGSYNFSDISSLLKGDRKLALPDGELHIKAAGDAGKVTRLRLDNIASPPEPILFAEHSYSKVKAIPLELSNGVGTSLDGSLQYTDSAVARLGSWAHVVNGGGRLEATVGHAPRTTEYERFFSTNHGTFAWNGKALKPNQPLILEGPGKLTFQDHSGTQVRMFRDAEGKVFQVKDPKSFRIGDGITFATDTR